MKQGVVLTVGVVALAIAAGSGYWLGKRNEVAGGDTSTAAAVTSLVSAKKEKKLLFKIFF